MSCKCSTRGGNLYASCRWARSGPSLYPPIAAWLPFMRTKSTDRMASCGSSDIERGSVSRIGGASGHEDHPVWSPDGKRLAINDRTGLSVLPIAASAPATRLLKIGDAIPSDWSADGKWIIYHAVSAAERGADIWVIPAEGGAPRPIVQTADDERGGVLSPDGRWLAYASTESGRAEVYLQPFPPDGRKIPVSVTGGSNALWDGNDRLYWGGDGRVVRTRLRPVGEGLELGAAEFLLMVSPVNTAFVAESDRVPYAVLPNGGFIRAHAPAGQPEDPLTVVLNWRSLLVQ